MPFAHLFCLERQYPELKEAPEHQLERCSERALSLDGARGPLFAGMNAARRARWIRVAEKWIFNRVVLRLVRAGLAPPYAIIETVGRRSGAPRQVPVANAW
jgi:hypothetical protein